MFFVRRASMRYTAVHRFRIHRHVIKILLLYKFIEPRKRFEVSKRFIVSLRRDKLLFIMNTTFVDHVSSRELNNKKWLRT